MKLKTKYLQWFSSGRLVQQYLAMVHLTATVLIAQLFWIRMWQKFKKIKILFRLGNIKGLTQGEILIYNINVSSILIIYNLYIKPGSPSGAEDSSSSLIGSGICRLEPKIEYGFSSDLVELVELILSFPLKPVTVDAVSLCKLWLSSGYKINYLN